MATGVGDEKRSELSENLAALYRRTAVGVRLSRCCLVNITRNAHQSTQNGCFCKHLRACVRNRQTFEALKNILSSLGCFMGERGAEKRKWQQVSLAVSFVPRKDGETKKSNSRFQWGGKKV